MTVGFIDIETIKYDDRQLFKRYLAADLKSSCFQDIYAFYRALTLIAMEIREHPDQYEHGNALLTRINQVKRKYHTIIKGYFKISYKLWCYSEDKATIICNDKQCYKRNFPFAIASHSDPFTEDEKRYLLLQAKKLHMNISRFEDLDIRFIDAALYSLMEKVS
jgi:hypothetical protein